MISMFEKLGIKKSSSFSLAQEEMATPSEVSSVADLISHTQTEANDEANTVIIAIVCLTKVSIWKSSFDDV